MKGFILKFSLVTLLAIAVTAMPVALHAQTTPASNKPAPHKISNAPLPFHGKVKSIDNSAKTISLVKETLQITSDTKILKMGKPATLTDLEVGDNVAGSYKKEADGKLSVISLRIGPKPVTDSPTTKTNTP
jgi:Cu/Ag efflux protein CusF